MKAIINGKIILKDRIIEGSALLYSSVVEGIVPIGSVPADAEIIDAKGGYVAPGLIDMHIHGYLGKDVCDGEEESIRTISKGLLANGVTGYLPTTMTVDMKVICKALEVCRALKEESKDWDGSVILGCFNDGKVYSTDDDYIGGICGKAEHDWRVIYPKIFFFKPLFHISKILIL